MMLSIATWYSQDTLCVIGIGLLIVGLVQMLAGGLNATVCNLVSAVGLILTVAITHILLDGRSSLPVSIGTFAVFYLVVGLANSSWVSRASRSVLRIAISRTVAILAVCSLGLTLVVVATIQSEPDSLYQGDQILRDLEPHAAIRVTQRKAAVTDRGRPIPLLEPDVDAEAAGHSHRSRELAVEYQNRRIEIAGDDNVTNCHGWIFTSGQFMVGGRSVELILEDNGYQPVSIPQPGDLIIYREANHAITHSAIVCFLLPDGRVMVESKWGTLGTFIHLIDDSIYGSLYSIYRTSRLEHVLQGCNGQPATQSTTRKIR